MQRNPEIPGNDDVWDQSIAIPWLLALGYENIQGLCNGLSVKAISLRQESEDSYQAHQAQLMAMRANVLSEIEAVKNEVINSIIAEHDASVRVCMEMMNEYTASLPGLDAATKQTASEIILAQMQRTNAEIFQQGQLLEKFQAYLINPNIEMDQATRAGIGIITRNIDDKVRSKLGDENYFAMRGLFDSTVYIHFSQESQSLSTGANHDTIYAGLYEQQEGISKDKLSLDAANLDAPKKVKAQGGLTYCGGAQGVFTQDALLAYLSEIRTAFSSEPKPTYPVTFKIQNGIHACSLTYLPAKKTWALQNANRIPELLFTPDDESKLAATVFDAFYFDKTKDNTHIVLKTALIVANTCSDDAKDRMTTCLSAPSVAMIDDVNKMSSEALMQTLRIIDSVRGTYLGLALRGDENNNYDRGLKLIDRVFSDPFFDTFTKMDIGCVALVALPLTECERALDSILKHNNQMSLRDISIVKQVNENRYHQLLPLVLASAIKYNNTSLISEISAVMDSTAKQPSSTSTIYQKMAAAMNIQATDLRQRFAGSETPKLNSKESLLTQDKEPPAAPSKHADVRDEDIPANNYSIKMHK